MSTIGEYSREGCLLSAMTFQVEIALSNQRIFSAFDEKHSLLLPQTLLTFLTRYLSTLVFTHSVTTQSYELPVEFNN